MSATDPFSEPFLFDHRSDEPASESPPAPTLDERVARAATAAATADPLATSGTPEAPASHAPGSHAPGGSRPLDEGVLPPVASAQADRKRLAEQLDALKRKENGLRRALAAAEHPELAEPIRLIEGRAFSVSRAEAKLAQGFSKSEARRREVIEKKLGSLRDKRSELDRQIGTLEAELGGLGAGRLATFGHERQEALEQLLIALGTHAAAFRAVGLDPTSLVPEIEAWLPELGA
jgi:hypothetical protein